MPLTDSDLKAVSRYERDMLDDCDNCDRGSSAPIAMALCTIAGALMGAVSLFVALLAAGVLK